MLLCVLFSSCGEQGLFFVAVHKSLIMVASLGEHGLCGDRALATVAPGLQGTGPIVVAHGLSCSVACGILQDQGSNPCLLHWQVDSLPLEPPGKAHHIFKN